MMNNSTDHMRLSLPSKPTSQVHGRLRLRPKPTSYSLRQFILCAAICITAGLSALPVSAEDTVASQRTELGVRQKLVQRKMVELEAKFTIVADRIREKDAKRADLLVETYQQSKELSLTKKMEKVSELLNEKKYDEADQELNEVVGILESLIRMLTNEKDKAISNDVEIAMLEKFKEQVKEQLQEQRKQTRDTEQAANKEQATQEKAAQIKAVNRLIEEQKKVAKETGDSKNASLKDLDKLADEQFKVRKLTEELKKNISGEKNNLNPDGTFKEQKENPEEGEGKPGEPKGEPKDPSEGKPTEGKPSEGKPSEGKPSEGKPSEGKPSEGKPSEGKPS